MRAFPCGTTGNENPITYTPFSSITFAIRAARAAPVLADETNCMGVIDHGQRVVSLGQLADLRQWRQVTVHREDAVGDDDPKARVRALLQLLLELLHVAVGVAVAARLAQPDAIDDAGVIERVGDDRVPLVEQRLEDSAVGVEAG